MGKEMIGELELNRIYQRDCIEGMRMLPDNSVDLIVIDPPYNIGKDARWDKYSGTDYASLMGEVFQECERVLKDKGSFYWFHNDMKQIRKLMDLIDSDTNFIFKQFITWNKIDPGFKNYGYVQQRLSVDSMRNYYNGFTEYCIYYTFQDESGLERITKDFLKPQNPFSKYLREEFERAEVSRREIASLFPSRTGGLTGCVSNWLNGDNVITEEQYLKIRDYLKGKYLRKEYEDLRKEYEECRYTFNTAKVKEDLRANSNVWLYPPAKKLGHITPKPVELIENIIRHSSDERDVVLDCFMGSGTTAVASTRLNRNFIGFEREPEYIMLANQRLENICDEQAEKELNREGPNDE
ncbi:DNA-methyltransferase [Bacillus haynesii]|uniref:DNA-methyltransferase n=1 Tax=Bacillus haynesii TaxID=1925021 RepID=UPI002280E7CB|nr:site-specific DNA-methyltransferase [Bacillus haynesii]MCY8754799.1 site-specific DNA-methyltransferase [Bacillus haynesii]MCY9274569.1 site-specific DNA-methyltransferase [Bacillus haynesii]